MICLYSRSSENLNRPSSAMKSWPFSKRKNGQWQKHDLKARAPASRTPEPFFFSIKCVYSHIEVHEVSFRHWKQNTLHTEWVIGGKGKYNSSRLYCSVKMNNKSSEVWIDEVCWINHMNLECFRKAECTEQIPTPAVSCLIYLMYCEPSKKPLLPRWKRVRGTLRRTDLDLPWKERWDIESLVVVNAAVSVFLSSLFVCPVDIFDWKKKLYYLYVHHLFFFL